MNERRQLTKTIKKMTEDRDRLNAMGQDYQQRATVALDSANAIDTSIIELNRQLDSIGGPVPETRGGAAKKGNNAKPKTKETKEAKKA